MPAGLLDEPVDDAEAEAGALAGGLGREERLEHAVAELGCDADAGIGHRQHHVGPRRQAVGRRRVAFADRDIAGRDGKAPAGGHRIARVDDEVQERRLDLRRIGLRHAQALAGIDGQLDALADHAPHHVRNAQRPGC